MGTVAGEVVAGVAVVVVGVVVAGVAERAVDGGAKLPLLWMTQY